MNRAHLLPCPTCARHVRVTESSCPFCGALLEESFRASPRIVRRPIGRVTRASIYALGTSTVAFATACGDPTITPLYGAPGYPPPDATTEDVQARPHYGGPPADAGQDAFPIVDAAYGGPPIDAGPDATPDGGQDSGSD